MKNNPTITIKASFRVPIFILCLKKAGFASSSGSTGSQYSNCCSTSALDFSTLIAVASNSELERKSERCCFFSASLKLSSTSLNLSWIQESWKFSCFWVTWATLPCSLRCSLLTNVSGVFDTIKRMYAWLALSVLMIQRCSGTFDFKGNWDLGSSPRFFDRDFSVVCSLRSCRLLSELRLSSRCWK